MSLLYYTGPPKIRAVGDDDWLELPYASFDNFPEALRSSESIWKTMRDRTQKRIGNAVWQRSLRFGYVRGHLDLETAEALLAILEQEAVEIIPRTRSQTDPCRGAQRIIPCRVVSDLPDSAHLIMGYAIEIELEAIGEDEDGGTPGIGAAAGSSGVDERTYDLGPTAGTVVVEYEMYTIPDEMELIYDSVVVDETDGEVSDSGTLEFEYDPGEEDPTEVTVRVTGNTDGGTAWDYVIYCPDPS